MFKVRRKSCNGQASLQLGKGALNPRRSRKAVKIAASVGAGVGTVLIAFAMTWLISI